ncbi:MAG: hypothetical protein JWM11_3981 [Planctomycetaceae bacterium]|nr:hypothetical protein [Planctomycetaceae bacterium]
MARSLRIVRPMLSFVRKCFVFKGQSGLEPLKPALGRYLSRGGQSCPQRVTISSILDMRQCFKTDGCHLLRSATPNCHPARHTGNRQVTTRQCIDECLSPTPRRESTKRRVDMNMCESCDMKTDASQLLKMWDGRDYCVPCLNRVHPSLAGYRLAHADLVLTEQTRCPTSAILFRSLALPVIGLYLAAVAIVVFGWDDIRVLIPLTGYACVMALTLWIVASCSVWMFRHVFSCVIHIKDGTSIITWLFRKSKLNSSDLSWSVTETPFLQRGGPGNESLCLRCAGHEWHRLRQQIYLDTHDNYEILVAFLRFVRAVPPLHEDITEMKR